MDGDPWSSTGFAQHLGLVLTEVSGDVIRGRLQISPAQHQNYGIVHGGVYCSVVEHAASIGAAAWYGGRGHVVGVSNHTNFVRAVREGTLTVEAQPLQRGRTQQLWQVFIHDAERRLVANGEVRLANIPDAASLGGVGRDS
jgi:1,4-dihydroxy-2-naphthoyl-CoA hydrolase